MEGNRGGTDMRRGKGEDGAWVGRRGGGVLESGMEGGGGRGEDEFLMMRRGKRRSRYGMWWDGEEGDIKRVGGWAGVRVCVGACACARG